MAEETSTFRPPRSAQSQHDSDMAFQRNKVTIRVQAIENGYLLTKLVDGTVTYCETLAALNEEIANFYRKLKPHVRTG